MGFTRWFNALGLPLQDTHGRIPHWLYLLHDIDDRKRAEVALRASETNLRELIDNIPGLVAVLSPAGKLELVNRQLLEYFGKTMGELNAWRINDTVHPDDRPSVIDAFTASMTAGTTFDREFRYLGADGAHRWFRCSIRPVRRHPDDEISGWYGVITDVDDRKRAEERLQQAQSDFAHAARLAMLGELTASIAHEVSQPLTAIRINSETAIRWLDRSELSVPKTRELMQRLLRDVGRATDIIARIRMMATGQTPQHVALVLQEVMEESLQFLRPELLSKGVSMSLDLSPTLPPVVGDRIQLQQVVVNLCINAMHAMAGSTRRSISIRAVLRDQDTVRCAIEDSGPGIDPTHLPRLFDSFFTTKETGMGLGLSICRSIIEAHEGSILGDNNSALGGARFSFDLPAGSAG